MDPKYKKKNIIFRHPIRSLGILVFLLGIVYGLWGRSPGQSAEVYLIDQSSSNTTITISGVLKKDTNFYVLTGDGQKVFTDLTGLDSALGREVLITGTLTARPEDPNTFDMVVVDLTTRN